MIDWVLPRCFTPVGVNRQRPGWGEGMAPGEVFPCSAGGSQSFSSLSYSLNNMLPLAKTFYVSSLWFESSFLIKLLCYLFMRMIMNTMHLQTVSLFPFSYFLLIAMILSVSTFDKSSCGGWSVILVLCSVYMLQQYDNQAIFPFAAVEHHHLLLWAVDSRRFKPHSMLSLWCIADKSQQSAIRSFKFLTSAATYTRDTWHTYCQASAEFSECQCFQFNDIIGKNRY